MTAMDRSTAIARIKANEDEIRALGATALYLFGSTARDEAKKRSVVDVFIDYRPGFTLFDLVGIKLALEEKLGTKVDVATRDGLKPMLRKSIEESAIKIF
jgi:predicted nucleotidyltransferase